MGLFSRRWSEFSILFIGKWSQCFGISPPPTFYKTSDTRTPTHHKKEDFKGVLKVDEKSIFFLLYWKMLLLQWAVRSQIFRGLEELQPQNGRQKQASNTSTPSFTTFPHSHPKLGKEGSDNIKFRILFYNPN